MTASTQLQTPVTNNEDSTANGLDNIVPANQQESAGTLPFVGTQVQKSSNYSVDRPAAGRRRPTSTYLTLSLSLPLSPLSNFFPSGLSFPTSNISSNRTPDMISSAR